MPTQPLVSPQKGRDFLLKISSGASPDVYVTVGGLRNTKIAINGRPIDISNKTSQGWQEMLGGAGIRSVDVTADGIMDTGDAQLQTVAAAALAGGGLFDAEIVSGSGEKFLGSWVAETFERTGNHDNAELFSVTLKSSGPVTYSST